MLRHLCINNIFLKSKLAFNYNQIFYCYWKQFQLNNIISEAVKEQVKSDAVDKQDDEDEEDDAVVETEVGFYVLL